MSTILEKVALQLDAWKQSGAPVDTYGGRPVTGFYEKRLEDIRGLIKDPVMTPDYFPAILDALRNAGGVGIDDRQLLLEIGIVAMSKLKDHPISQKMQEAAIALLYKDLPHPPSTYLCLPPVEQPVQQPVVQSTEEKDKKDQQNAKPKPPVNYAFRPADGTNYNILFPTMGKAGSPYARSVPSKHCLPKGSLPDPGLIFDTLLKRDEYKKHPGGVSSMFFAFADLVIHSIFDTDHTNWSINKASSYLDLSVLYGSSEAQVDLVRNKEVGTGQLWNDVFGDRRLLHMPPASCALLVLLSRNHNYIAQKIFDINESGKYTKTFTSEDQKRTQDDEIFHRARLVNCGYFMHIILGDYVGAILGLVRDGSDWRLDPLMNIRNKNHDLEPVGEGNVVSVEFNLLYRWHSTLSDQDAKWTTEMFERIFEGRDLNKVTIDDFKRAAHANMRVPEDPREWVFSDLKRGADGRFNDDELANILHNATEWCSSAFKARGIPAAMRIIEVMGIEQARSWGTCSLNEFRKFLGLKPHKNFEEWNSDPEIHHAARALYKDIDNLELYVGLQAEEAKEAGPGAGLCPGYTVSRAILADAVCLTRGDRFLTSEFTPANLTSWGFQDCQYDKEDGSYGGLLTKLLFRTLPNHYPRGSAYAHFPFLVPEFMENNLREHKPDVVDKYTWSRPKKQPTVVPVQSYAGVKQILSDRTFISAAEGRLSTIAKSAVTKKSTKGSWRGNERRRSQLRSVEKELLKAKDEVYKIAISSPKDLATYFEKKTRELIKEKAFNSADKTTKYVDIVQDVINLVPIHWISYEIAGLSLKTAATPNGTMWEQDTYKKFLDIAEYVHLNLSAENDWRLRESSQAHSEEFVKAIKGHVDQIDNRFSIRDALAHMTLGDSRSHVFLKKVVDALEKRYNHREIAGQVFAAVVPTAALYSGTVACIVEFFLAEPQTKAREELLQLLKSSDSDAPEKVQGYIREAIRLNPPVPGFYRTAGREIVVGPQTIQAFEVAYTSVTAANIDKTVFGPDPEVPVYNRPQDKAGIFAFGENSLVSEEFLFATVPSVLRAIFEQKGLRRGPGRSGPASGAFTSFKESYLGSPREMYINTNGAFTQLPDSLLAQFDP